MKTEFSKLQYIFKFIILIKPYWESFVVFILCGMTLTILSLPYPWLTKMMIDDVMLRQDTSLLYVILTGTLVLSIVRSILSSLNSYYTSYIQHSMALDIQFNFLKHLQGLSFTFYDKNEVAEVLSRLRDAARSRELLINILTTLINNLLYLSVIPIIVFFMNWKLALIAGFTMPWMAFSFFILSRIVKRYTHLSAVKVAEISVSSHEFLAGVREIQALGVESRILRGIKLLYLQFRKLDMTARAFGNFEAFISSIVTAFGTMLYTWYGATLVINERMTVGELTAFTAFIAYMYNPLTKIVSLMVPIQEVLVHTERFYEVYDRKPEIVDKNNPVKVSDIKGRVTFSDVYFAYNPKGPTLENINLDIPAGTKVALVGESGAGKTTLINLLPRFYEITGGRILIDNIDIRDISLNELRSNIGIVAQNPFIFSGRIVDNINCGRRNFTHSQIVEAAKAANLHQFITSLPDGYDSIVGEGGIMVSGGERQRIALARVFLLDRPILILDEATSNIDSKAQIEIEKAIARAMDCRTTFIITHRLSTIQDADMIIVLDKGRIIERGRHGELIQNRKTYFKLCDSMRLIR